MCKKIKECHKHIARMRNKSNKPEVSNRVSCTKCSSWFVCRYKEQIEVDFVQYLRDIYPVYEAVAGQCKFYMEKR